MANKKKPTKLTKENLKRKKLKKKKDRTLYIFSPEEDQAIDHSEGYLDGDLTDLDNP